RRMGCAVGTRGDIAPDLFRRHGEGHLLALLLRTMGRDALAFLQVEATQDQATHKNESGRSKVVPHGDYRKAGQRQHIKAKYLAGVYGRCKNTASFPRIPTRKDLTTS